MAAERHGPASTVVLQVWSDATDARFVVARTFEGGVIYAAGPKHLSPRRTSPLLRLMSFLGSLPAALRLSLCVCARARARLALSRAGSLCVSFSFCSCVVSAAGYIAYRVICSDESGRVGPVCFISDLYVRPRFRRRGLARRMLRRLTQPQRHRDTTSSPDSEALLPQWFTVQLHVICDNEAALQLYLSEGFEQLPVPANVAWEDRDKRVMEYSCS